MSKPSPKVPETGPAPILIATCLTGAALLVAAVCTTFGLLSVVRSLESDEVGTNVLPRGVLWIVGGLTVGALLWASAWTAQRLHRTIHTQEQILQTLASLTRRRDAPSTPAAAREQPSPIARGYDDTVVALGASGRGSTPTTEIPAPAPPAPPETSAGDHDPDEAPAASPVTEPPAEAPSQDLSSGSSGDLSGEALAKAEASAKEEPAPSEPPATAPEPPPSGHVVIPVAGLSLEQQARNITIEKRRVEDLMSIAHFVEAEQAAQELLSRYPGAPDARDLLETVRRESNAFRTEQQTRLYAELQKCAESRQWRRALDAATRLIERYPASRQARKASSQMDTITGNARIEEVRDLRDRFRNMMRRKRFDEAADIAAEVVKRFPETQVARELSGQISDLRKRAR